MINLLSSIMDHYHYEKNNDLIRWQWQWFVEIIFLLYKMISILLHDWSWSFDVHATHIPSHGGFPGMAIPMHPSGDCVCRVRWTAAWWGTRYAGNVAGRRWPIRYTWKSKDPIGRSVLSSQVGCSGEQGTAISWTYRKAFEVSGNGRRVLCCSYRGNAVSARYCDSSQPLPPWAMHQMFCKWLSSARARSIGVVCKQGNIRTVEGCRWVEKDVSWLLAARYDFSWTIPLWRARWIHCYKRLWYGQNQRCFEYTRSWTRDGGWHRGGYTYCWQWWWMGSRSSVYINQWLRIYRGEWWGQENPLYLLSSPGMFRSWVLVSSEPFRRQCFRFSRHVHQLGWRIGFYEPVWAVFWTKPLWLGRFSR